jgi:hypothetical protein
MAHISARINFTNSCNTFGSSILYRVDGDYAKATAAINKTINKNKNTGIMKIKQLIPRAKMIEVSLAILGSTCGVLQASDTVRNDNTYNFGGGNTLQVINSYNSATGASSHGTVSTWGNGAVNASSSSYGGDATYQHSSDNKYNLGGGNTLRTAKSYDSATGARTTDTTLNWGNGNSTRTISGCDAMGKDYRLNVNTYNWGSGRTTTTVSGHDAQGNYVSKTISK